MNISTETKFVGKSRKYQSWVDYEEINNPVEKICTCMHKTKYK